MVYLNPIFFVYRFSVPKVIIKVGCVLFPTKKAFFARKRVYFFFTFIPVSYLAKIPLIFLCCVASVLFVRECSMCMLFTSRNQNIQYCIPFCVIDVFWMLISGEKIVFLLYTFDNKPDIKGNDVNALLNKRFYFPENINLRISIIIPFHEANNFCLSEKYNVVRQYATL